MNAGLYYRVLIPGQTGMGFVLKSGATGGTREIFWRVFIDYIRSITEKVLLGHLVPHDAKAVFRHLAAFEQILAGSRSSNWLSTFRNDLQYSHANGVWPPTQNQHSCRSAGM